MPRFLRISYIPLSFCPLCFNQLTDSRAATADYYHQMEGQNDDQLAILMDKVGQLKGVS
jgi:hypothetical protein